MNLIKKDITSIPIICRTALNSRMHTVQFTQMRQKELILLLLKKEADMVVRDSIDTTIS